MFKTILNCRVCKSGIIPYAKFPPLPLANNLCITQQDAMNATKFSVTMAFCPACGISQLLEVVDSSTLFEDYAYRSSISNGYRNHIRRLIKKLDINSNSLVIDIAGNDGTALKVFQEEFPGIRVLNVDPARNLVKISEEIGVNSYCGFWPECIPEIKDLVADADPRLAPALARKHRADGQGRRRRR